MTKEVVSHGIIHTCFCLASTGFRATVLSDPFLTERRVPIIFAMSVRLSFFVNAFFITFCLGCYSEVESNSVSTFQVELQHFISMRETECLQILST